MTMENSTELSLEFEHGTFSLWEILTNYPLPVVVQCDTCPVPVDRSRFNFDLRQPLLLYRKRNIQKVLARSIHIDPDTRCYNDIGDPLLIPEDYRGWFSVLRRNYTGGPVDDLVPNFQKVSDIVDTNTETFLIGGERKVQALQIALNEDGILGHQQRTLFPGDVLRKGKIYIGQKKKKSKYLRKTKLVTEKYLLCTDESDREVLLPFDQKGLFYTLTANSGNINRPVMQMHDIVARKSPPCIVRLVYGRIPNTPCSFSGTLRLDRSDLENSVIAATMVNSRNILLEIPTSCDLKFRVAVTSDELVDHSMYKNALELCNEKATIYMRNMKVCHSIDSDSHLELKEDIITNNNTEDTTASVNLKTSVSSSNSTSSNDISSNEGRNSDYFEMRSLLGTIPDEIVDPGPPPCSSCSSNDSYTKMDQPSDQAVLNIFLENSYMAVPVVPNDHSQLFGTDDLDPPDLKPPPPPSACLGTPPKPCLGSFDSGIQMENESAIRRPSTITFVDGRRHYEENITYDIPRLPSRRVSAPAGCSLVYGPNEEETKETQETKQNFARRASTIPNNPTRLQNTLFAPNELFEKRITNINPVSRLSDEIIPEYDSDEEYGSPLYQNIKGLNEIEQEPLCGMENTSNNTLKLPSPCGSGMSSNRSSFRDSGRDSPSYDNSSRSSYKYSGRTGRLSPALLSSISIGPIPELPKSRSSSPYPSKLFENESSTDTHIEGDSKIPIPDLPKPCPRRPPPCRGKQKTEIENDSYKDNGILNLSRLSNDYEEIAEKMDDVFVSGDTMNQTHYKSSETSTEVVYSNLPKYKETVEEFCETNNTEIENNIIFNASNYVSSHENNIPDESASSSLLDSFADYDVPITRCPELELCNEDKREVDVSSEPDVSINVISDDVDVKGDNDTSDNDMHSETNDDDDLLTRVLSRNAEDSSQKCDVCVPSDGSSEISTDVSVQCFRGPNHPDTDFVEHSGDSSQANCNIDATKEFDPSNVEVVMNQVYNHETCVYHNEFSDVNPILDDSSEPECKNITFEFHDHADHFSESHDHFSETECTNFANNCIEDSDGFHASNEDILKSENKSITRDCSSPNSGDTSQSTDNINSKSHPCNLIEDCNHLESSDNDSTRSANSGNIKPPGHDDLKVCEDDKPTYLTCDDRQPETSICDAQTEILVKDSMECAAASTCLDEDDNSNSCNDSSNNSLTCRVNSNSDGLSVPTVSDTIMEEVHQPESNIVTESSDKEMCSSKYDKKKEVNNPIKRRHISTRRSSRDSIDVSKLTVEDLAIQFKRVGIKDKTIELLKRQNLNGPMLLEKYSEFETIKEFLPNAGLIDQQKISLFIQGCKY